MAPAQGWTDRTFSRTQSPGGQWPAPAEPGRREPLHMCRSAEALGVHASVSFGSFMVMLTSAFWALMGTALDLKSDVGRTDLLCEVE